ncbi:MAG: 6-phosphogluconolactonase [Candidatus Lambdaproteobacteria bacterium]|nr:6-phosphogluconolactonase [Candidatus Lambdaproteobacteria bacterium]
MTLRLEVAPDPEQAARAALALLRAACAEAIAARGRALVSLAGGSTPKLVYRQWAQATDQDWPRIHLLYGDERCVPPDHADSNHRMVQESLLDGLPAPPQVHRMRGEDADPEVAAADYGRLVRDLLGPEGRLDLALLGMGPDGHTASLFPGRPALAEAKHRCVATLAPDGRTRRLTLTIPVFKAARQVVFLVTGAEKAATLRDVLEGPLDSQRLPAQTLLRDPAANVVLVMDRAAAGQIKR